MSDKWAKDEGLTEDAPESDDGPRYGEPLFYEPWHSKAFTMAVTLNNQGDINWNEFETRFVDEIHKGQAQDQFIKQNGCNYDGFESVYYHQWLAAFERLLVEKEILETQEIQQRISELRSSREGDETIEEERVRLQE